MKKKRVLNNLALERTLLANERTMLAHIRTAGAAFLFGLALLKLFENQGDTIKYVVIASFIVGAGFLIFGIIYYPLRNKRIKRHEN